MADFREQFIGTTAIKEAIGADIVGYAYVRSEEQKHFQLFQSWPFVRDGDSKATAVSGLRVEGADQRSKWRHSLLVFARRLIKAGRLKQAICCVAFISSETKTCEPSAKLVIKNGFVVDC
jgi:hypothetical protein